jgi:hypothetical protein
MDVKMSRQNAIRFLAILENERSENIFSIDLGSDLEMNVTVARSMEKKDGHAEILTLGKALSSNCDQKLAK